MQKPDILVGILRLGLLIGVDLGMSVMLRLWYLLPDKQVISALYLYLGWGLFVTTLGFVFYAKRHFSQKKTSVKLFAKTPKLMVATSPRL